MNGLRSFVEWCEGEPVRLGTPLSVDSSFRFPLQNERARREVLWGAALLLLLPGVGWLLNMGHRIRMVHRMQHGLDPWPSWQDYSGLMRDGTVTFLGMLYYYTPGFLVWYLTGFWWGAPLLVAATLAIPGYGSRLFAGVDGRSKLLEGLGDSAESTGPLLSGIAVRCGVFGFQRLVLAGGGL